MGAAFPMLAAAAVRPGRAGRQVGTLYAANTIAGVGGAFATGFFLLPAFGVERSFEALALTSALASVVVLLGARLRGRPLAVPALAALGIGGVIALLPSDHFQGVYLHEKAEFVAEGTTTSVAVVEHAAFGEPSWLELATPGVSMSDTRFASRRYQMLMGHLPLLLARERKSALLICFGVGNTARALLSHPEVERVDIVDISPEVLRASPYFARVTGSDPLLDPRARVTVGDGRAHLVTSGRAYDVITSEPPPPNHAGVVNLYSREYYAAARAALAPGGVVAQWLPVFQLHPDESLAIVAAMAAEMTWVSLYLGYGYQWILVGADAPPAIDVSEWARVAAAPSVTKDLAAGGVLDVEDVLGAELADDGTLRRAIAGVQPVTDDLPVLPYPLREIRKPVLPPPGLIGEPLVTLQGLGIPLTPALGTAAIAAHVVVRALPLAYTSPPELRELVLGTALRQALAARPKHAAVLGLLDVDDDAIDAARRALSRRPNRSDAALALARRAFYEGEWLETLSRLEAVPPAPAPAGGAAPVEASETAIYWLVKGGAERALARFDDARRSFERAADASRDEGFRANVRALARKPDAPWPPEVGPLARPAP